MESDLGIAHLNRPLAPPPPAPATTALPPLQVQGLSGSVNFRGGGCLLGEADPHPSRSAAHGLALLQRGLEEQRPGRWAVLSGQPLGRGSRALTRGSVPSQPHSLPSTPTSQATPAAPHLSPFSRGQVPTNLPTTKENILQSCSPPSLGAGEGRYGQKYKGTTKSSKILQQGPT